MAVYQFGSTTFSSNIFIKGGDTFPTPLSVAIDPEGSVTLTIEVINFSGGNDGGVIPTGPFSSAVNFPIDHVTSPGNVYQIRLNNSVGGTEVNLNGGSVYY